MAKISDILATGVGGILPMMMAEDYKRNATAEQVATAADKARQQAMAASAQGRPMKKGGMTASSRADGCCVKGKTRGKMV